MPNQPMSDAKCIEALNLVVQHGTVSEAARQTGMARATLDSRVKLAKSRGLEASSAENDALETRDRRRMRDEIARLRRELDEAHRSLNQRDDLREAVFGLAEPINPRDFELRLRGGEGAAEIPLLFTSDFQWGETIDMNEMGGLNIFNRSVASARYRRLIERTIELCTVHHAGEKPPGIYYVRGGDAISGEIHDELERTNDLMSGPALMDLAEHEAWGIGQLAEEFGRVIVISVPGNHDRSTKKPSTKGYVATSFDSIISWHLEAHFRADPRVTFLTPKEPDALFRIYNTTFLVSHGDQIGGGGGQGFIGPAASITRGMKKVSDYYASIDVPIDCILVGHFHTSLKLEYGFSNGCLPGYSEFARKFRMRPKPPTQWLLHVHPKRGIVSQREVMVGAAGEGLLCDRAEGAGKIKEMLGV